MGNDQSGKYATLDLEQNLDLTQCSRTRSKPRSTYQDHNDVRNRLPSTPVVQNSKPSGSTQYISTFFQTNLAERIRGTSLEDDQYFVDDCVSKLMAGYEARKDEMDLQTFWDHDDTDKWLDMQTKERRAQIQVLGKLKVRDRIEVNYKKKGIWYPATYEGEDKDRDGYYLVIYTDKACHFPGKKLGVLKSNLPRIPVDASAGKENINPQQSLASKSSESQPKALPQKDKDISWLLNFDDFNKPSNKQNTRDFTNAPQPQNVDAKAQKHPKAQKASPRKNSGLTSTDHNAAIDLLRQDWQEERRRGLKLSFEQFQRQQIHEAKYQAAKRIVPDLTLELFNRQVNQLGYGRRLAETHSLPETSSLMLLVVIVPILFLLYLLFAKRFRGAAKPRRSAQVDGLPVWDAVSVKDRD